VEVRKITKLAIFRERRTKHGRGKKEKGGIKYLLLGGKK